MTSKADEQGKATVGSPDRGDMSGVEIGRLPALTASETASVKDLTAAKGTAKLAAEMADPTRTVSSGAIADMVAREAAMMKGLTSAMSLGKSAAGLAHPPLPHPAPRALPAASPPPIKTTADLGALVRAAREAASLSQQQLADQAGVGRRFVSELENGKPTLEFDKVAAVAAALGIDLFARKR